jgi:hypothetical protein
MNTCQAGHEKHDRLTVPTMLGDMIIFNFDKYKDFAGYCTGQDDVSRTLQAKGEWDSEVTYRITSLLKEGNKSNLFVDIGSHIGWFSRLAQIYFYSIIAYDGDKENLELLYQNVPTARTKHIWFDKNTKPRKWCPGCSRFKAIEVMKIDLEGNDQYGVEYYRKAFEQRAVKNLIMEVSPVFNYSYRLLLERLQGWGYKVFELSGEPFNWDFSFKQRDLWVHL